ncbi:alpha/beta fold hydrolase [Grimontia marina]|uniref:Putative aminoacrylate hydrolase RutD n=1 Tax=Grimontia marina TaxID=646534 RepID=A0A128FIF0_9GAMM|nr:alpha/beta hydrolase [Grimontia marina]CZF86046.1 Putative aminoacrylate hydrolase RutD [Grimontia marina]
MKHVILNSKLYRYSMTENKSTEQVAIFLLGALQDIESVRFYSESFSKTLTCITLEIPGTGYAEPLGVSVSIQEQSQMLLDFINYMDIQAAHVIGFSYATAIATELCCIWRGVKSLSICGGVPGIPKSGIAATKRMIAAAMQSKREFADTFINSLTVDDQNIPRSKVIKKAMAKNISNLDETRISMFFDNSIRLLVHKPSNIKKITVPAIVCAAEHDPYVTTKIAKEFCEQLPNSQYMEIKNSDHLAHLEHPEIVATALILLASSAVNVEKSLYKLSS